ncbi:MAG: radical SAM family heme chaperone HemW [Gammaproteobacteria bacterium]|nr:radical SAM family heme chaperone HemW [Gammaproteobacteria bacterium]
MTIPLSLYVHIPWCVQKCPYCDFNSHNIPASVGKLPEREYVARLLADLDADIARFQESRPLSSIFVGGGTPSLFSGAAITELFDGIRERIYIDENTEITLEANPGTVDERHFADYFRAGINRISIGVQSFNATQLKKLGRIHNPQDAIRAVKTAQDAGFDNINIDLMFGLPEQTAEQAYYDVEKGISLGTEHLSYYQLTLEPNTAFAHKPPKLPIDEKIDTRFDRASEILIAAGFKHYEVSAWSRGRQSKHNRNYWEYGDYLGIGAGSHGKITTPIISPLIGNHELLSGNNVGVGIVRTTKPRSPTRYLSSNGQDVVIDFPALASVVNNPHQNLSLRTERLVSEDEKAFEFMLNTMRLIDGFPRALIEQRGLISESTVMPIVNQLVSKELLYLSADCIKPTALGQRFVNDMVESFL